jgi:hypothetical protein
VLGLLAYDVVNLSEVGLPDLNIVFRELDLNIVMPGSPILASFSNFRVVLLRASQVVSEPQVLSIPTGPVAYRLTLPTVVVESSVKTILLNMRWIVLIRSAILLLAYVLLSSYLCEFCVLSLIYFFEF